jgi:poly(hydroxyalkanoate) granule-associated protein
VRADLEPRPYTRGRATRKVQHVSAEFPQSISFTYSEIFMVTKLQKSKPADKPATAPRSTRANKTEKATQAAKSPLPRSSSVKDSAQQIWQAGLGAIAKAQAEGSKALESLIKESTSIQRKTQAAAEEKVSEATSRMTAMAGDISSKASGHWDKLESIFEDRVAKALNKLGVPSSKDVNALMARMDELNKAVQKLAGQEAARTPAAKAPRKSAASPRKAKATVTASPEVIAAEPAAVASEAPVAKRVAAKRARKVVKVDVTDAATVSAS